MIPSAAWLFLCRTRPSAQAPTLSDQPARFQPPVWFADGQKANAALLFAVAFQLRSFEASRLRGFAASLLQLPNPNIPKADRRALIAVRLQFDRRSIVLLIKRLTDIQRLSFQRKVILHQHTVEEHSRIRRRLHRPVIIKYWSSPHDIIGLPLSRLATGIHQRSRLLVNACGHPIHVSLILVGIQDLQLISGVARPGGGEEQSAVSPRLTAARHVLRNLP